MVHENTESITLEDWWNTLWYTVGWTFFYMLKIYILTGIGFYLIWYFDPAEMFGVETVWDKQHDAVDLVIFAVFLVFCSFVAIRAFSRALKKEVVIEELGERPFIYRHRYRRLFFWRDLAHAGWVSKPFVALNIFMRGVGILLALMYVAWIGMLWQMLYVEMIQ